MTTAPSRPLPMPVPGLRSGAAVLLAWLLVHLLLLAPLWQPRWEGAGLVSLGQADWRLVAETGTSAWQAVGLPHAPRGADAGQAHAYRVRFSTPADAMGTQPLGICVPHGAWRAEVALDGRGLHAAAQAGPADVPWMRPQFIALPAALQAGAHQLLLRAHPVTGLRPGLSEVLIGPAAAAQALCDGLAGSGGLGERLHGILAVVALAALVVAGLRRDASAGWFGVLAVGALGSAWLLSPSMGALSEAPWVMAFLGLHALMQIPLFFFVRSSAAVPARFMVWIVPLAVAAEVLVALCMPGAWRGGWLLAVAGLWLLLGLWLTGTLIGAAVGGGPDLGKALLALSVGLAVLAVAAQLLSWWGGVAVGGGWVPAAGLVCAVSYVLYLVLQLIAAESRGRAAQAEQAGQLARERAELVAGFELRQQRQESEVQARERTRIMRELHDGLGSPLVAALALLSSAHPAHKAAADLVDLCLQELRNTIDTLGGDCRDVGELLGAFRDRIEPVLHAQGIALDWQVQPLLATANLHAGERLHVMRIVQEAFTNILKHSGASQVVVRAETHASGCSVIDIIDNGGGLRPGVAMAPGWGLSNMHERAALLGAQLSCTEGEAGGVHVRLALNCGPFEALPSHRMVLAGGAQPQPSA